MTTGIDYSKILPANAPAETPTIQQPGSRNTMQIIAIYANDWAMYSDEMPRTGEFSIVRGWIVGALVSEDDAKIVLAHEWFPGDDKVRCTSVIQKHCIEQRIDCADRIYDPR